MNMSTANQNVVVETADRFGLSDAQIGEICGVHRGTVQKARLGIVDVSRPMEACLQWYARVRELEAKAAGQDPQAMPDFIRDSGPEYGSVDSLKEAVRGHYREFAGMCGDDPARWGWWLMEIRERFPENKWGRNVEAAAEELLQKSVRDLKSEIPVFPKKKR